ncbi:MerR family DNA-binding transcriptional regulator [Streptococcus sp. sy018]|uniref:MerR family DNA-binding transcriptional regulator n=1 Tax=Streptococcus sp. sy018 TaxID=2600147 RepID=UPI0011B63B8B|nr:MerR family DNA-binding transcriptional regulator [Streptococcus sp. sy018]TWS95316.1 MerR family DNA-binding transcriptional regulator [Streptococcus sp. sy018]
MADFQHFLTIGQLSKFSGIHIKALRYYEKIGILSPSHINQDNGYRYYSHSHIPYVALIKMCADYGLPLKDFNNYILDADTIDMSKIIQEAREKITQIEKQVEKDKAYLQNLQDQLLLSDQLDKTHKSHLQDQNDDFLLFDFQGKILSANYHQQARQALLKLEEQGLQYDNRLGCYYTYQNKTWQQYLAVKVKECLNLPERLSICLNQKHIHAEHIHQDQIDQRLKQLHRDKGIQSFLILETFENPYHLSLPHLELRYIMA